jgi:hypothetical protein
MWKPHGINFGDLAGSTRKRREKSGYFDAQKISIHVLVCASFQLAVH